MTAIAAKLQALKKFRKTDNLCSTEEFFLATKAPYPNSPRQQSYISLRECGVTAKQYLLVDIFVNSHYLSDWQCIKIVRWILNLDRFCWCLFCYPPGPNRFQDSGRLLWRTSSNFSVSGVNSSQSHVRRRGWNSWRCSQKAVPDIARLYITSLHLTVCFPWLL